MLQWDRRELVLRTRQLPPFSLSLFFFFLLAWLDWPTFTQGGFYCFKGDDKMHADFMCVGVGLLVEDLFGRGWEYQPVGFSLSCCCMDWTGEIPTLSSLNEHHFPLWCSSLCFAIGCGANLLGIGAHLEFPTEMAMDWHGKVWMCQLGFWICHLLPWV